MKAYTWTQKQVISGISLESDERLGQVIYLGESGRKYEKIALDKFRPARVTDDRVVETDLKKVTLPARGGKPEKVFFTLEEPRRGASNEKVLVRISTRAVYTKNSRGSWKTHAGDPETLVRGYGAHGAAGRIGNWYDGLVAMASGDVLYVKPEGGHKTSAYALFIEGGVPTTMRWEDFENQGALRRAEEKIEEAKEGEKALEMAAKTGLAYTFRGGKVESGIATEKGATGDVVALGEDGRGRKRIEVSTLDITAYEGRIFAAGVAVLDRIEKKSRYGSEPTVEMTYGLVQEDETSPDVYIVRVDTSGPYTKNSTGEVKPHKGDPQVLVSGRGAHGAAGYVGGWSDSLVSMHEGDVVYVRAEGGSKSSGPWALFVEDGELQTASWHEWRTADGKKDPAHYVGKGCAPKGHVPADWIGRVVTVKRLERDGEKTYLREVETGEFLREENGAVILNLGWDRQDFKEKAFRVDWVNLEEDKQVRRLEGEEAETRAKLRAEAETLKEWAGEMTGETWFTFATADEQSSVRKIAQEDGLALKPSEGWYSLSEWIESSRKTLEALDEQCEALQEVESKQGSGEVLAKFGGHFRRMGNSGNADWWVICRDGTLRDPDEVEYRKRYTSEGRKQWSLVRPNELALEWDCNTMHDVVGSSRFIVAKAPVEGYSVAQLATVARIEDGLEVPRNAFGLHADVAEKQQERLDAIKRACLQSVLSEVPEDLDYLKVTGKWGSLVYPEYINPRASLRGTWTEESMTSVENREGCIVHLEPAADGMLEFITYEKWGDTNLNIRWRELRDGEEGETAPARSDVQNARFEHVGKRNFRCPECEAIERITKGDMQSYQAGKPVEIACPACGAHGAAHKQVAAPEETPKAAPQKGSSDALSALMGRFNK